MILRINIVVLFALCVFQDWVYGQVWSTNEFYTSVPDDVNIVSFRLVGHKPIIDIKSGGRKWKFLLDTGAALNAISPKFAEENFLSEPGGTTATVGVDKAKRDLKIAEMPPFWIGSSFFVNKKAVLLQDLDMLVFSIVGEDLDGVIGFNSLKSYKLVLNYKDRHLLLLKANQNVVLKDADYWRTSYQLSNGVPCVALTVQNRDLFFDVDTGSARALAFPANRLGFKFRSGPASGGYAGTVSGFIPMIQGRLSGSLNIGPFAIQEPLVTGMEDGDYTLGGQIMQHFCVTIDPFSKEVEFGRAKKDLITLGPVRLLGVLFDRSKMPWRVLEVDPASIEAVRTIQRGDLCSAVNGEAVSEWSYERFSSLVDNDSSVTLTISRVNSLTNISLPVVVLIP